MWILQRYTILLLLILLGLHGDGDRDQHECTERERYFGSFCEQNMLETEQYTDQDINIMSITTMTNQEKAELIG